MAKKATKNKGSKGPKKHAQRKPKYTDSKKLRSDKKDKIIQKKSDKPANTVERTWQKPEEKRMSNTEVRKVKKTEGKSNETMLKTIITEQIYSTSPDVAKIRECLAKLKSRGLKQRLNKKAKAAGIVLK